MKIGNKTYFAPHKTESTFFLGIQHHLGLSPEHLGAVHFVDDNPPEPKLTTEPPEPPGDDGGLDLNDNLYAIKKALKEEREARKAEAKARKAEEESRLKAEQVIEQYKKHGNPEEVEKAMEAVKLQQEREEAHRKQLSEANKKAEEGYKPIIDDLTQKYENEKQLRISGEKRTAVERWFNRPDVSGVASEFDYFYQLAQNSFEYDPETKKIIGVKDRNGEPLYFEGKAATPAHLMAEIRKGEWGRSLSACFEPYQRSSGSGIPPNDYRGNKAQYEGMNAEDKFSFAFGQNSRKG